MTALSFVWVHPSSQNSRCDTINTIISTYFYDQNYYIYACNIDHKIIQMANCLL